MMTDNVRNQRLLSWNKYFSIGIIFVLAFFYHSSVQLKDERKKESADQPIKKSFDLNAESNQKIYNDIIQSQQGDVFRVGMVVRAWQHAQIEVFLTSSLSDEFKAGEIDVAPTEFGEYKEIVFVTPDYYEDIELRYSGVSANNEAASSDTVSVGADIYSFFASRLDIKSSAEMNSLAPTLYGISDDGNTTILDGAKLEDMGERYLYSYALKNDETDLFNLFSASEDIFYNPGKKMVMGYQRRNSFFVYKFDTVYPFDRFVLHAVQAGSKKNEIRLEYSFDNVDWREIPLEKKKDSWQSSFAVVGNNKTSVLYIRTSYGGKEKNSGSFGLQELSVSASLPKLKSK